MKILFVLENYYPLVGGVEVGFRDLAEGLAKLGNEVSMVTQKTKNASEFEILNGVKIHRVSCLSSRYWFTFFSIPKVLELAKRTDIIHTTTYNGAFPARVAARIFKKPSLITVHEVLGKNWQKFEGMNWFSARLHQFLEKLVISLKFDRFISHSKSTEKSLVGAGIPKEKSRTIYGGIDYDFFDPRKYDGEKIRKTLNAENSFVYLFYGRPGISKGVEYLIRAVSTIGKRIENSKLLLILSRDKAYRKRYNYILKLITQLRIRNEIILLDPVPTAELPNYIKAADCVVIPSLTEGFGRTAAEACAMDRPVVASDTTSLPEVVRGKYVLVEPGNPAEIAEGVELIYRGKVEDKGKKVFSLDEKVRKHLDTYTELVKTLKPLSTSS